jgi:nicotinamide-nucleotide amidase
MDQFASDPPVEERVADALTDREQTVAVAESCTGGLIGALLTAVPGASRYFDRALATYSYDAKQDVLGITREALDEHGAVSEPVARQMARAARDLGETDWGLSATGIAGPGGGTEATPVGTVFLGLAWAAPWDSGESGVAVERYAFDGNRAAVRERTARQALADLLTGISERSVGEAQ